MIRGPQLVATLHLWLTRCYPRSFRAEFEDEMAEVFAEAAENAARCGRAHLLWITIRELRDWPWATLTNIGST